jgi:hypothetical protein
MRGVMIALVVIAGVYQPELQQVRASASKHAPISRLSSQARLRKEAAAHPRFGSLSVAAHGDAELADQLAYGYSHDPVHELVDLTDEIAGTGPIK